MVLLDVELHALPGRRDQFAELVLTTQLGARQESGCEIYRFGVDLEDPDCFRLTELWADEAALLSHLRGATFQAFLTRLPEVGRLVSSAARAGELTPYQMPPR